MLRRLFALALSTSLLVSALPAPAPVVERASAAKLGYISVSVATVWTNSGKVRPGLDDPALTNPVDNDAWLGSMTKEQFLNLTDDNRTQTQAVYGTEVTIIDEQAGWYSVLVSRQPTPKSDVGYPGWIPAAQVTLDSTYGKLQSSKPFALVDKAATTKLYRDVLLQSPFVEISYDTRLPVILHLGLVIQVAVPGGGSAYLPAKFASVYTSLSKIPTPTGADLIKAGKMFIGRPYLWGGRSGWAYDCSGFTGSLYSGHGIVIPRDADAQANFTGNAEGVRRGTPVARNELQVGDLLYYGSNPANSKTVHHVTIYAGNNQMLEAFNAGTPIRLTEVRDDDYWGAGRFL